MSFLIVRPQSEDSYRVAVDRNKIRIGRAETNDIALSDDLSASRFHAEVRHLDGSFVVEDVGSRHGTRINGRLIHSETSILPGDEITVGQTVIRFSADPTSQVSIDGRSRPLEHSGEITANYPQVAPDMPLGQGSATLVIPASQILSEVQGEAARVSGAEGGSPQDAGPDPVHRAFSVLTRAASDLMAPQPVAETLDLFLGLVFDAVSPERGAIMMLEGSPPRLVVRSERDATGVSQGIRVSQTIAKMVVTQQQSVLTEDAQLDDRLVGAESVYMEGVRSAMCVPLWNNERVIGALYADSVGDGGRFGKHDLEVMTLLGNLAAIKIEHTRLFQRHLELQQVEQEMETAARIQKYLLPAAPPELSGHELTGMNVSCREVGGDYFDYQVREDGRCVLAIGDVCGKGMSAALLMSNLQASFRAYVGTVTSIAELATRLNRTTFDNSDVDRFITFFCGELDAGSGELAFVNAGHNPPLLFRATGEVEELMTGGLILGIKREVSYTAGSVQLAPEDLLVLYSDGVTESRSSDDEEFEKERLIEAVKSVTGQPLEKIQLQIVDAVNAFTGGGEQQDDITLCLLRRT